VPCRSGKARWRTENREINREFERTLRFFRPFWRFSTPIRAAIPVCCTRLPCCAPNREFFGAETGNIFARNQEFAVCPVSFNVSRSSCMTRMVSRSSGVAGVSPKSRRAVTDGAPFQRQLALADGTTKGQCYSPLFGAESPSCSGFNLPRIEAYSYIVNPDLALRPSGFAADTGAETPKSAAGSFSSARRSCTSKIAPNQCCAFARRGSAYRGAPAVQETGGRRGRRV